MVMSGFKKSFKYAGLTLESNIFYSPLAGCSNLPFRQMSAKYGSPGLQYCEMVKMQALQRGERETFRLLDMTLDIHPIGAQLVGSDPRLAGPCAKILEDMGFDALDLNCGCPVDKVTRDGSGSGLLQTPWLIGEILHEMTRHVKIPVSVKVRAGWDDDHIIAPDIARIAKQAGACAMTVHARTREQAYRGGANWSYIKACKEVSPDFLIIGNGDVFCPESAARMFQETGCDAIMASRGTMGKPWLAQDIGDHCLGKPVKVRTLRDALGALQEHYEFACQYLAERQAIIEMRKVSTWYLEPYPCAKSIRSQLAHAQDSASVKILLQELQGLTI